MILPDLVLPSRANQHWQYSGIDSPELCLDIQHFLSYPYSVDYVYNSRGFRDQEWPDSLAALQAATWCIGDSFTVGIGQPLEHIWPRLLARAQQQRTINISMDGASNDWIFRRALDVLHCVDPVRMIVMWSYTNRRESDRVDLPDCERRIISSKDSFEQDYFHWIQLSNRLYHARKSILQFTVPDFHPIQDVENTWHAIKAIDWPACPRTVSELEQLPRFILDEMINLHGCYHEFETKLAAQNDPANKVTLLANVIPVSQRLDWARDHHHFGLQTADWIVKQIIDADHALVT